MAGPASIEPFTDDKASEAWASALLLALARDEATGRRPQRVTEPDLATWRRFRGRLGPRDFVALMFEDAAVVHPVPFDPALLGGPLRTDALTDAFAEKLIAAIPAADLTRSGPEYILEQARTLGVNTRLARSDLHVVKPHHKVLELPGSGGQLAHHLVASQKELSLHDNFVVACASWQELALAGVVALERGAPHTDFLLNVNPAGLREPSHPLRQRAFDFVIGLHPDKGGHFRETDQLAIWFPKATIILV